MLKWRHKQTKELISPFSNPQSAMIEIVPYNDDVTCIKTATEQDGQAIMFVYSFLIRNTLFDAGCGNAVLEFEEFASKNEIDNVYISHSHEDHVGCLHIFDGKTKIYANEMTQKDLRNPQQIGEFFDFVWGQPKPILDINTMLDTFSIGDLSFEVIPLPGHAADLIGFYEPKKRWFFSFDAIPLPSKKKIAMPEENVPLMVVTMEKIRDMDIEILFDSHKGPIENPREHIQPRIDYINMIQKEATALHESGKSIDEIQVALGLDGPWYLEMTKDRFGIDFFLKSVLFDKADQ
ncbi:MAG: MBL fold metallo-hydrolase [Candidatus Thorarchaeota archaeon]|nr:MAG: MBL fold metallo-hydrolase [Candidatus Thorarchaeota archaeon]